MDVSHPISDFAASVQHALIKGLPDIEYFYRRPGQDEPGEKRTRRPTERDVQITSFYQTWGSTATMFGGMGGAAMTTAMTVVVFCRIAGTWAVYCNGDHAYNVPLTGSCAFPEDLKLHNLVGRREAATTYGAIIPQE